MSGSCLTKGRIGGMIQIKSSQAAERAPSQHRCKPFGGLIGGRSAAQAPLSARADKLPR
jgi:hypothetical protein